MANNLLFFINYSSTYQYKLYVSFFLDSKQESMFLNGLALRNKKYNSNFYQCVWDLNVEIKNLSVDKLLE